MARRGTGIASRRIAALVAGIAAAAFGGSLIVAPAASAVLPTTTTLTASAPNSVVGDSVTLTAAVYLKPLGGLVVTPSGYVYFSASNGAVTTALGRAKLGSCFRTSCIARLTTTALPAGSTSARASYAGDLVAGASAGSTPINVTPVDDSTAVTCGPAQPCSTPTITSSDGQTQLSIDSPPSAGGQTVTASLDSNARLHCPGDVDPEVGPLATFNTTSPTGEKVVHYVGYGSHADQMDYNYGAHTTYVGCFGAPHPFNGYTNGVYGPAQFVSADGLYEAQLSSCANNSNPRPCFTNIRGDGYDEVQVTTQPGDPKVIV